MRERVGAWDLVAAGIDDGSAPPNTVAYGFQALTNNAPTDAPNLVAGSIAPDPAVLHRGANVWRLVALTQLIAGGRNVELVLGAPSTDRRVAAPAVNPGAPDVWLAVPGVVIDARRRTTYTFRPGGAGPFFARADVLRGLRAAVAGGDAAADGTWYGLGGDWRIGITAARGLLIARRAGAGQVNLTIDADDGPSTAEAADPPAGVDWRIGDRVLRYRDATVTHAGRSNLGGRYWESTQTLSWADVPAGTIAAGAVEVTALGPDVDSRGVAIGAAAPDHPPLGQPWIDTSDEDDVRARVWNGSGWEGWLAERIPAVAALPANPIVEQLVLLTAQDGARGPGLYACRAHGVWEKVGGGPATSPQTTAPPRLVTLWGAAAARPANPFAAAGAEYGADGWITLPPGWVPAPGQLVVPVGQSRWRATAWGSWQSRWTFSGALIELDDAYWVQYATDAAGTGAHSNPTVHDTHYRRRDPLSGAWSPWLPIDPTVAPAVRAWSTIVDTLILPSSHYPDLTGFLLAPVTWANVEFCRVELAMGSGAVPVWRADRITRPFWGAGSSLAARNNPLYVAGASLAVTAHQGTGVDNTLSVVGRNGVAVLQGQGPSDTDAALMLKFLRLTRAQNGVLAEDDPAGRSSGWHVYESRRTGQSLRLRIDVR